MRSPRPSPRLGPWAAALSLLLSLGSLGCLAETNPVRTPADSGEVLDAAPRDAGRDAGATDARPRDTGVDAGSRDAEVPDAGFQRYTWWGDIRVIVYANCVRCHTSPPLRGAELPLLEWADTQITDQEENLPVYRVMANKVLTVHAGVRLADQEIQKFQGWAAFDGPEGERPDSGLFDDAGDDDAGASD